MSSVHLLIHRNLIPTVFRLKTLEILFKMKLFCVSEKLDVFSKIKFKAN